MENKVSSYIWFFLKIILVLSIITGSVFLVLAFCGIYKTKNSQVSESTVDNPKFCTDLSFFDSLIQCLIPFKSVFDDLNGKTAHNLKVCMQILETKNSVTKNHTIFTDIINESKRQITLLKLVQENGFEKLCDLIIVKLLEECNIKKLESNLAWTSLDKLIIKSSFIKNIKITLSDVNSAEIISRITFNEKPLFIKVPGPKLGIFSLQLIQGGREVTNKDLKEIIRKISTLYTKYGTYELKSFAVNSGKGSYNGDCAAYRKELGDWYNIYGDYSKRDNNFDLISNIPSVLFYMRVRD